MLSLALAGWAKAAFAAAKKLIQAKI